MSGIPRPKAAAASPPTGTYTNEDPASSPTVGAQSRRQGSQSYNSNSPSISSRLPQPSNSPGTAFTPTTPTQQGTTTAGAHKRVASTAAQFGRPSSASSNARPRPPSASYANGVDGTSTPKAGAGNTGTPNRFGFLASPNPNKSSPVPNETATPRSHQAPQADDSFDGPDKGKNRESTATAYTTTTNAGTYTTQGGDSSYSHGSNGTVGPGTSESRERLVEILGQLVGRHQLETLTDVQSLIAHVEPVPQSEAVQGRERKLSGATGDKRQSALWLATGLPPSETEPAAATSPTAVEEAKDTVAETGGKASRKMSRTGSSASRPGLGHKRVPSTAGSVESSGAVSTKGLFGKFGWRSSSQRQSNKLQKKEAAGLGPSRSLSSRGSNPSDSVRGGSTARSSQDTTNATSPSIAGTTATGKQGSASSAGTERVRPKAVFGVPLSETSRYASCVTIIGGQRHVLPIVAFAAVEDIYKRGMGTPGLLRIAGDLQRIDRLVSVFDSPPSYGDRQDVSGEDVHTLCGLLKRFLRALPDPLLDPRLTSVFWHACVEPAIRSEQVANDNAFFTVQTPDTIESHSERRRVAIAQCILRLLPSRSFSLLVYVTAFLSQVPLFPGNKLTLESVSAVLGPALLAPRDVGLPGLGVGAMSTVGGSVAGGSQVKDSKSQEDLRFEAGKRASEGLLWLLRNWNEVTDGLLEERFDVDVEHLRSPTPGLPLPTMPGRFPSANTPTGIIGADGGPKDLLSASTGSASEAKPVQIATSQAPVSEERAELINGSHEAFETPAASGLGLADEQDRSLGSELAGDEFTPPARTVPLHHDEIRESTPFSQGAMTALQNVNGQTPPRGTAAQDAAPPPLPKKGDDDIGAAAGVGVGAAAVGLGAAAAMAGRRSGESSTTRDPSVETPSLRSASATSNYGPRSHDFGASAGASSVDGDRSRDLPEEFTKGGLAVSAHRTLQLMPSFAAPVSPGALKSPNDILEVLSNLIHSRDDIIQGQAQRISDATERHAQVSRELAEHRQQLERAQGELQSNNHQSETLKGEVAQLMAQLQEKETEAGKLRESMLAEQERSQKANEDLSAQLAALRKQMQDQEQASKKRSDALEEELERARKDRDEHFSRVKAVKAALGFLPGES